MPVLPAIVAIRVSVSSVDAKVDASFALTFCIPPFTVYCQRRNTTKYTVCINAMHHRRSMSGSGSINSNNEGINNGLGLSTSNSIMSKRISFPAVSTPSVHGGGGDSSIGEDSLNLEEGASSTTTPFAIREHEYDDNNNVSINGHNNSSTMAFRRSIDAVARGSSSPYSTPLLGGDAYNKRNSNDYSPAASASGGYGGRHVSGGGGIGIGLPGSPTVNGTGKKPLLLNTAANTSVNIGLGGLSPVSTPTFGSSMAALQAGSLSPSPPGSAGWRKVVANGVMPSSKRRIHPLALGPAFLLGVVLALSGIFSSSPSTSSSSTPSSSWESWTSPSTSSSTFKFTRPPTTSHESGHIFLDQGRIEAGEADQHPIHGLVREAGKKWNALLKRQSRTLEQAVKEYRRRYGRNPPKGFDDW